MKGDRPMTKHSKSLPEAKPPKSQARNRERDGNEQSQTRTHERDGNEQSQTRNHERDGNDG
jgi:hypothetical protein